MRNEVVHVFPSALIPDRENFLKLKIGEFEVHDRVEVVSWKLHTLVTPMNYGAISIGATGDARVDLVLRDTAVGDVLDAFDWRLQPKDMGRNLCR